jgi:phenylacetic acid degradation operon negative regulatory protein
MHSDRFIDSTAPLRALGGQRVWSLMISLFGDLAQGEGDRIDGPVLSAIMASLQIKPEAARVALHRLRNDGWITSAKSGRIRQHSLTAKGRAESAIASPRIYAAPDAIPDQWQLVLVENSDAQNTVDMTALGFTALTTRAYLGPVGITAPVGALALRGAEVPEWLRREAAPAGLREDYARLDLALSALTRDLAEIPV